MRWVLVLLLGAGCRQVLGLDEGVVVADAPWVVDEMPIDVPVGHDEDMDGVGDEQDNCPTTVNADQAIVDMVGMACDPRPSSAGDRIALFVPFFPDGEPVSISGNGELEDDHVLLVQGDIHTTESFRATRVTADLTVLALSEPNASLELVIGQRTCRLEQCGVSTCIVADDILTMQAPVLMFAVDATLSLTQNDGQLQCSLTQGMHMSVTTQVPSFASNDRIRVKVERAMVRIKNLTIYDVVP